MLHASVKRMKRPLYSIILPVRNEAQSLPILVREIKSAMGVKPYEIITVDDGSTDGSVGTISIAHQGKWTALRTGIAKARGNIIITMDADLQDDPKEILSLLKKLHEGFDVVSGWRKRRRDPLYKIALTSIANAFYGYHDFASPMKAYRIEALRELPIEGAFLRYSFLFAQKLGMKIVEIPVSHRERIYGKSKFGPIKYFRILYDIILISLIFRGSGKLRRET